jgi:hypothetical protein
MHQLPIIILDHPKHEIDIPILDVLHIPIASTFVMYFDNS